MVLKERLKALKNGSFDINETILYTDTEDGLKELRCCKNGQLDKVRPTAKKLNPDAPMITGHELLITLFPVAKGGSSSQVPRPFGGG